MTLEHSHTDKWHKQREQLKFHLHACTLRHAHYGHPHTQIIDNQIIKQTQS